MSTVWEIESALRKLPAQEKWEIANWLLDDLEEAAYRETAPGANGLQPLELPDYAARRRRIFGAKVLPNMVIEARAQERW